MRNPIFDISTIFTDVDAEGKVARVNAATHQKLSCGARLIILETPQHLVRITTDSGIELDISPETAFAMGKTDAGFLLRWQPVFSPPSSWLESVTLNGADRNMESVSYMLAGLICGSGLHSTFRNRATTMTVPFAVAIEVEDFLMKLGDQLLADKVIHERANSYKVIDLQDGTYFIRSRIFNHCIGELLTPKVQRPTFDLMSAPLHTTWAFLRGVLSALLADTQGNLTFANRDASVVESVASCLWLRFGVPCEISIDPMEPRFQFQSGIERSHKLKLSAESVSYAVAVGLRDGRFDPSIYMRAMPDPIMSAKAQVESRQSVIVMPAENSQRRYPITANGLIFNPAFQMPAGIAEIATHPILVNDPAYF